MSSSGTVGLSPAEPAQHERRDQAHHQAGREREREREAFPADPHVAREPSERQAADPRPQEPNREQREAPDHEHTCEWILGEHTAPYRWPSRTASPRTKEERPLLQPGPALRLERAPAARRPL